MTCTLLKIFKYSSSKLQVCFKIICAVSLQWTALILPVQAMALVLEGSVIAKQGGRVSTVVLWISRCTNAYLDVQNMAVTILRLEHVSAIIIGLVQTVPKVCLPFF
jgi:hypothetical protein